MSTLRSCSRYRGWNLAGPDRFSILRTDFRKIAKVFFTAWKYWIFQQPWLKKKNQPSSCEKSWTYITTVVQKLANFFPQPWLSTLLSLLSTLKSKKTRRQAKTQEPRCKQKMQCVWENACLRLVACSFFCLVSLDIWTWLHHLADPAAKNKTVRLYSPNSSSRRTVFTCVVLTSPGVRFLFDFRNQI